MIGELLIVNLLLELSQEIFFGLVAVLENGLHVTAVSLLDLLVERGNFLVEALVVGCGLG